MGRPGPNKYALFDVGSSRQQKRDQDEKGTQAHDYVEYYGLTNNRSPAGQARSNKGVKGTNRSTCPRPWKTDPICYPIHSVACLPALLNQKGVEALMMTVLGHPSTRRNLLFSLVPHLLIRHLPSVTRHQNLLTRLPVCERLGWPLAPAAGKMQGLATWIPPFRATATNPQGQYKLKGRRSKRRGRCRVLLL